MHNVYTMLGTGEAHSSPGLWMQISVIKKSLSNSVLNLMPKEPSKLLYEYWIIIIIIIIILHRLAEDRKT